MTAPQTPESGEAARSHSMGTYGDGNGPLLVGIGSLHGNEPAGTQALIQVLAELRQHQPAFRGKFAAIVGNRMALDDGVRYLDLDLNRIWTPARIGKVRAGEAIGTTREEQQFLLILQELDALLDEPRQGPAVFLDLHTSSASGAPFATVGDTLRNRAFALKLPLTRVLGIEEQIDGGLLAYVNNLGHITLGFEAGRHDDPASLDRHAALLWLGLEAIGCVDPHDVPNRETHVRVLRKAKSGLPGFIEVRYRHPITPDDGFKMEPGWTHFAPVRRGELLARDSGGEIRAYHHGYVLLPLYQGKGSDGFFLGRGVRPFWLWLSAVARRLGIPRIAHWLPGVRRVAGSDYRVEVDLRVARFQSRNLFHLLGFRRRRREGDKVVWERRVE